jgi:hypothetical protein
MSEIIKDMYYQSEHIQTRFRQAFYGIRKKQMRLISTKFQLLGFKFGAKATSSGIVSQDNHFC